MSIPLESVVYVAHGVVGVCGLLNFRYLRYRANNRAQPQYLLKGCQQELAKSGGGIGTDIPHIMAAWWEIVHVEYFREEVSTTKRERERYDARGFLIAARTLAGIGQNRWCDF